MASSKLTMDMLSRNNSGTVGVVCARGQNTWTAMLLPTTDTNPVVQHTIKLKIKIETKATQWLCDLPTISMKTPMAVSCHGSSGDWNLNGTVEVLRSDNMVLLLRMTQLATSKNLLALTLSPVDSPFYGPKGNTDGACQDRHSSDRQCASFSRKLKVRSSWSLNFPQLNKQMSA